MARHEDDEYEYEEDHEGGSWIDSLASASWRRAIVVPLILILFGFGSWMMWKKYRVAIGSHPSYHLDPQQIQYTAPPEWLKRDILAEVIQHGSLESKKSHDAGLTVQVANAFGHHPWIKRVDRVRIFYPAKLDVELTYRNPTAMVVMPDDDPTDDKAFLQPIDADAVWLPPEDFSDMFAREFPRIDVGNTSPPDRHGASWGDGLVADAAKIAEVLGPDWGTLKTILFQIERSSQPTSMSAAADFDIRGRWDLGPTPPGLLVRWGRAPGKEQAGEPTAKAKLKKLKEWVQARSTETAPRGEIDLRTNRALQATKPGKISR